MSIIVVISIIILALSTSYSKRSSDTHVKSVYDESQESLTTYPTRPEIQISPTIGATSIGPTATNQPTVTLPNNTQYIYPGSSIVTKTATGIQLESNDTTSDITQWYKNKINNNNMNTKSFVSTSTNGVVLNKLIAAGNNQEIRITITKYANATITSIKIEQ